MCSRCERSEAQLALEGHTPKPLEPGSAIYDWDIERSHVFDLEADFFQEIFACIASGLLSDSVNTSFEHVAIEPPTYELLR